MNVRLVIPLGDQYKSAEERAFAQYGPALLADHFGVAVFRLDYEAVTWYLPGGKYTPDWHCVLSSGIVVFVEVKGNRLQRGYRDARSKLRAAAALHPEYSWCEVLVTFKRGTPCMVLEVI